MTMTDRIGHLRRGGQEAFRAGRYEEALFHLGMAADRARLAGMSVAEADIRNTIALVFTALGNRPQAEIHFKLALSLLDGHSEAAVPLRDTVTANLNALRRANQS